MNKRVVSGMRPTGNLHLGNYFGAIRQFLELADGSRECYFFVADLHALTEATGPTEIDSLSVEVARNYLACGLDPSSAVFYRQSEVPEVSELAVLLGNDVRQGRLKACTTYRDRVENRGIPEGEISFGLLGYPVLMAADILAVRGEVVPVGEDQRQHVEMAAAFARSFNAKFGGTFIIPNLNIAEPIRVPGIDGSGKMGKSLDNTISLLDTPELVLAKVKKIPTQTKPTPEMEPGTAALYALLKLCSPPEVYEECKVQYDDGTVRFGDVKVRLAEDVSTLLAPIQARYASLDDGNVREILRQGANKARRIAADVVDQTKRAMGVLPKSREGWT